MERFTPFIFPIAEMMFGGMSKKDQNHTDEIVEDIDEMDTGERKALNKVIKNFDYALSDAELKAFCRKNGMEYNECDLKDLTNTLTKKTYFVFTGEKMNDVNKGADHHWLYLYYNYLFDPAGSTAYSVPSTVKFIKTHPKQIQAYESVVCGKF